MSHNVHLNVHFQNKFQAELEKKLKEETMPRIFGTLNNFLESNGGDYFVGTKVQISVFLLCS